MKNRCIFVVATILITLALSFAVFAHPGKTDSFGGHYDHKNGGYHYHHGYPAHGHYDMDGDGTKDCPYDFKDATNPNGSTNNSHVDDDTTKYDYQIPEESENGTDVMPFKNFGEFLAVESFILLISYSLSVLLVVIYTSVQARKTGKELEDQKQKKIAKVLTVIFAVVANVINYMS